MNSMENLRGDREPRTPSPEAVSDPFVDADTAARVMQGVVRQSAVALVVTDLEHRIRIWSVGAQQLLGYAPGEIQGRPHSTIVPESLFESDERELRARVEQGEQVFFFPTERLTKDGRRVQVEVCRSVVRDEQGRPLGYSSIILDLTEKRAIQERLLQAERLTTLARVVGKVFHELRTPLGVLVLQTEILSEEIEEFVRSAKGCADPQLLCQIRETLGYFAREVRRIENIGEDYLLMIRPIRPHRSKQVLGDFLKMVREELQSRGDRPGYKVQIESGTPEAIVQLDPFQFLRVFHNLAGNSLEAIPDSVAPVLTLQASLKDEEVVFRFRDNGPGLLPELQHGGAFEIFTTTKKTGSGLGLHLVQEIVGAHGGRITLQNHPGGGAEAVIVVPTGEVSADA